MPTFRTRVDLKYNAHTNTHTGRGLQWCETPKIVDHDHDLLLADQ